jgi:NAD-dependent dihydropyrimidine dehydrogenase PreA subunit
MAAESHADALAEDHWMLREDKKLQMVRLSATLPRIFMGRWALQAGQKVHPERWKDTLIEEWRAEQRQRPVRLRAEARRTLWWFRDRFYWDDDDHLAEDVKALVLQRGRRDERRLKSARALMRGEANGSPARAPIPQAVARTVFERDGDKCLECGSCEDLQFDHIIPVALGGATSPENLQILCGDCNRSKSDAL